MMKLTRSYEQQNLIKEMIQMLSVYNGSVEEVKNEIKEMKESCKKEHDRLKAELKDLKQYMRECKKEGLDHEVVDINMKIEVAKERIEDFKNSDEYFISSTPTTKIIPAIINGFTVNYKLISDILKKLKGFDIDVNIEGIELNHFDRYENIEVLSLKYSKGSQYGEFQLKALPDCYREYLEFIPEIEI